MMTTQNGNYKEIDMFSEPVLSRKALISTLEDRAVVTNLCQNRPYTFVQLTAWFNDKEYLGYGFSKVTYPDQWNPSVGASIATRRAIYMVMHQIRADERGHRRMEVWTEMMKEVEL